MRRLFVRHLGSSATGRSKAVSNLEEAEQFAAEVGFPVVLKPIDLYGSLFVRRFDSLPEFKIGFTEIQKSVALKSGSTSVKLQIEEFLTGSNHSVECVVDHRGVVSTTPVIDVLTGRDIGREDFHHFARWAPTLLSDKAAAEMKSLAVEACRSLALTATIAHVEFIMTASGPKLLELAVRPGGNRARLLSRIYGIDILHAYYSASVRKPIDVNVRFTKPFAMVSPFPPNRQAYAGLSGESRITSLETYESHKVQVGIGDILGSAAEGFFSPMMIELSSEKIECLRADAHRVATFTDLFIKGDDKL
jgi:biotin carboxylase